MPAKRKINRNRVAKLITQGYPPAQVAKDQKVSPSTITRYLEQIGVSHQQIEQYKKKRADLKAVIGIKAEIKQLETLESINPSTMSDSSKNGFLMATNAIIGTRYQEERLERELSTSNISYLDVSKRLEQLKADKEKLLESMNKSTPNTQIIEQIVA
jgi:hypothetical protein